MVASWRLGRHLRLLGSAFLRWGLRRSLTLTRKRQALVGAKLSAGVAYQHFSSGQWSCICGGVPSLCGTDRNRRRLGKGGVVVAAAGPAY